MESEKQSKSNAERQRDYRVKLQKKGFVRVEIKLSKDSKRLMKKLCKVRELDRHQLIQSLLEQAAATADASPDSALPKGKKLPAGLHASEIPPPNASTVAVLS
jgi:hypothetical protein